MLQALFAQDDIETRSYVPFVPSSKCLPRPGYFTAVLGWQCKAAPDPGGRLEVHLRRAFDDERYEDMSPNTRLASIAVPTDIRGYSVVICDSHPIPEGEFAFAVRNINVSSTVHVALMVVTATDEDCCGQVADLLDLMVKAP